MQLRPTRARLLDVVDLRAAARQLALQPLVQLHRRVLAARLEQLIARRHLDDHTHVAARANGHRDQGELDVEDREEAFIEPKPVVIVEGILIFAIPRVLDLLDVKVFVDTPDDIRLMRRLRRDYVERGRSFERTLDQYERTIRPMHIEFVEPARRLADIIIPEGDQMGVSIDRLCGLVRERLSEQSKAAN